MPMFPPAPTLFSMTNCWPRRSDRNCPMIRATVSFGPPAVNETIQWTGRVGYPCAQVMRDTAGSAAAPAARCRNCLRGSFIESSLHSGDDPCPASLRLDVRGPDHLAPLLGLFGDELAEVGRRAC